MKKRETIRRFMVGLIDGLSLPFALAAGLSVVLSSSRQVVIACLAITLAGAITMTAGGYMTGRAYQSDQKPFYAALSIGIGYLAGGIWISLPYFFSQPPLKALAFSSLVTLPAFVFAGYYESTLNESNGWTGALRVLITGSVAAACAIAIAQLFG